MFKQALQANRDSTVSMLELAEIYYLQHKIPASTEMYEQYVRTVGQKNQSARALWVKFASRERMPTGLGCKYW